MSAWLTDETESQKEEEEEGEESGKKDSKRTGNLRTDSDGSPQFCHYGNRQIVAQFQAETPMEIVEIDAESEAEEVEDVYEGPPTQAQMNFCLEMMQKYIECKESEEDYIVLYQMQKIVDRGSTSVKQVRTRLYRLSSNSRVGG